MEVSGNLAVQGEKCETNTTTGVLALWPTRPKAVDPSHAAMQWRDICHFILFCPIDQGKGSVCIFIASKDAF